FLAIAITIFWLLGGSYYISSTIGWSQFLSQPLEALGSFLEGAFAPLAFLWLVVGYFLQQKELSRNTDAIQQQHVEMQRSSDQAELQAQAIQQTSGHNQRLTFMRMHDLVCESMGSTIGLLYLSSQAADVEGTVSREEMIRMWSEMSRGDHALFARQFMMLNAAGEQPLSELFFGTEIRSRHSKTFMSQFERLLAAAQQCDPDGLITDSVKGNVNGRLYRLMYNELNKVPLPDNW
ncbi:MAG: hypothetical protein AAF542_24165, partial [Pseudomonadota bacterium]